MSKLTDVQRQTFALRYPTATHSIPLYRGVCDQAMRKTLFATPLYPGQRPIAFHAGVYTIPQLNVIARYGYLEPLALMKRVVPMTAHHAHLLGIPHHHLPSYLSVLCAFNSRTHTPKR